MRNQELNSAHVRGSVAIQTWSLESIPPEFSRSSRLQFISLHRSIFKENPVSCSLFSDRFSVCDSQGRLHKTSSWNLAHGEDYNYCGVSLVIIKFSWSSERCPSKDTTQSKDIPSKHSAWHKCVDPDGCFGYDEAWSRFGNNLYTIFADIILERSTLEL